LLVLALIAFVLGFVAAAKWMFVIAIALLLLGLVMRVGARRRTMV
jgi:hypothetical protein